MGSCNCSSIVSNIKNYINKKLYNHIKIVFVGLNGSGKTTLAALLSKTKYRENFKKNIVQTNFWIEKTRVSIFVIPSELNMREYWDKYYNMTDAMVFFINSKASQSDQIESRNELHSLIFKNFYIRKPILVLGTFNDKKNVMNCRDIIISLNLANIVDREVSCFSISNKTNNNIPLAKKWIVEMAKVINDKKK